MVLFMLVVTNLEYIDFKHDIIYDINDLQSNENKRINIM